MQEETKWDIEDKLECLADSIELMPPKKPDEVSMDKSFDQVIFYE